MIFPEEADMTGRKPDANPELEAFENISIRSSEMVKGNELVEISSGFDRSPLAPPSPKRPSESWLCHNLPSVTSQITSRRYHPFNPQKQDLTENYRNGTKWETIVKTSYMHRDHIRYSEVSISHFHIYSALSKNQLAIFGIYLLQFCAGTGCSYISSIQNLRP
jgi:hypothetical protein